MVSHAARAFAHHALACDLGQPEKGGHTSAVIEGNIGSHPVVNPFSCFFV